eukprot:scaffold213480_cov20-Tisochrysis_lutea.AAC.1
MAATVIADGEEAGEVLHASLCRMQVGKDGRNINCFDSLMFTVKCFPAALHYPCAKSTEEAQSLLAKRGRGRTCCAKTKKSSLILSESKCAQIHARADSLAFIAR